MSNTKLSLSPPWNIFYKELQAFFCKDPDTRLFYDEENNTVKLYVDDSAKALQLSELLVSSKKFGSSTVKVEVIPSNTSKNLRACNDDTVYDVAFRNNPVYKFSKTFEGVFSNPITYVVFKKEIVQIYTDNLNDYHGVTSMLYQNIAEDIFKPANIFYCTDTSDNTTSSITIPKNPLWDYCTVTTSTDNHT